ncbi:hypothetical protein LMH87_009429 [Akanthomyces muscarius]|uniref:Uncharacterized protein n=1 Tax=Akanthomyces muscarius TaxID=2231603 RepID=A0A9W8QBW3_AKAMU|nr:hypothetical protein LMH87_009429 [Akanthomyces muscarius]KAJ4152911.1 hypothetical protein LMH87_009429 [Akanthomyces muscarius]
MKPKGLTVAFWRNSIGECSSPMSFIFNSKSDTKSLPDLVAHTSVAHRGSTAAWRAVRGGRRTLNCELVWLFLAVFGFILLRSALGKFQTGHSSFQKLLERIPIELSHIALKDAVDNWGCRGAKSSHHVTLSRVEKPNET